MILHSWGEIEYCAAREKMQLIHSLAMTDGQNHLILCSHPDIFTIGSDEKNNFALKTITTDRGGSISCHSVGQNIYYFCFSVNNPAKFYKKVLTAFECFFMQHLPKVTYHKDHPGFYIQNRKIASLGFRYSQKVSLHGVALNVDVDLKFHSQINPCNLAGILPTSLRNEGIILSQEQVNQELVTYIQQSFEDAV